MRLNRLIFNIISSVIKQKLFFCSYGKRVRYIKFSYYVMTFNISTFSYSLNTLNKLHRTYHIKLDDYIKYFK